MTETRNAVSERAFWEQRLAARVERLQKLIALKAPATIICNEVILVMKATSGLAPVSFGNQLAVFFQQAARASCGLCTRCGVACGGADWCPDCEAEVKAEAAADDALIGQDVPS